LCDRHDEHVHLVLRSRPGIAGQWSDEIPAELSPILRRLRLSSETWVETVLNFGRWFRPRRSAKSWRCCTAVETVLNFGRWFRLAAGRVDRLAAEAARRGRRWLQGVSHSRAVFA